MAGIKLLVKSKLPFKAQKVASCVMKELNQTDKVSVEVEIVDGEFIKAVNKDFRGIDKVTDVLSFPTLDGIRYKTVLRKDFPLDVVDGRVFLGSIIICKERVEEQAKEYLHSEEREFCYLFCHGLLHLFGYDHIEEKDEVEMRSLTTRILEKINVTR